MFRYPVNLIPDISINLKDKIYSGSNHIDDSLFMTATALLYSRVEKLSITNATFGSFDKEVISSNPEFYSFCWFRNTKENPDYLLEQVKNKFKKIEKLPTHEKFLSDKLGQQIYIRLMPEENTVCVFTTDITYQVYHAVQFFIPKFFKIFKEKPLTNEEKTFLETLTYGTNGNYIQKITEIANTESFKAYVLKNDLESFEKKLFEQKVKAAERELTDIEAKMNSAMEQYRLACEKRIEAIALVSGLKSMTDQVSEHTELQNYLLNNRTICRVSLNNSTISYFVKTYLAPYYVDDWEVITKNKQRFDQYTTRQFNNTDDIKLLLDAIFSEKRCLRLRMCAYFSMDYFGTRIESKIRYPFEEESKEFENYVPNPHLNFHNCFGQNKEAILDQLKNGDAIGAIECSVACAQRVNIHESMTFRPFVSSLLNTKGKCLVSTDGKEMTVSEAIAYLKGQTNE